MFGLVLLLYILVCVGSTALSVPSCNFNTVYTYPVVDEQSCVFRASSVYFHGIFDFQKPSAFPLFVNQVCRALSVCIPPENFRLVFHTVQAESGKLELADQFMAEYNIKEALRWNMPFDTRAANKVRQISLADVNLPTQLILQVDADEFISFERLSAGIKKLLDKSNRCTHLMGILRERVEKTGRLVDITLSDIRDPGVTRYDLSIESTFPWICSVKKSIEEAQDRKLVLYSAIYRPQSGNHQLMCSDRRREYSECMKSYVNSSIPPLALTGRYNSPYVCSWYSKQNNSRKMYIDHYKYTNGIVEYLRRRVARFRKMRMSWYKESEAMLAYLESHNNSICVNCVGPSEPTCRKANISRKLELL